MDFKGFADMFKPMTCIMSVEKFEDGSFGNIRIVTGNDTYINAMQYYESMGAHDIFTQGFIPDSPYERYIPKDLNFEEYCYRCAILGEQLHTYIKPGRFDCWLNLTMMPLVSDKENIGYCTYSQEITQEADASKMTDIAPDIAGAVLNICIKLSKSDDFSKSMNDVIVGIRELCDSDHCCILLTDHNTRKCTVLCEDFAPDTKRSTMNDYLDEDFFDIAESWNDTIAGSTCIIIKDKQEWEVLKERNPRWYKSLKSASVESIVLFPLRSGNEVLGYIWAIDFDAERTVKIKETLELTTFFVSAHIANHLLFKRMEIMSSIDILTGILNRNAMNNRIDDICAGRGNVENVGIVFADLNGLKRVNDKEGHFAGDMLLKNAALVLQKEFEGCEIYRAGGDEFMIIAADMAETQLEKRVEGLKAVASDPSGVCFAVGVCYDNAMNIKKAMRIADERMYANKEEFYKKHPEIAR